MNYQDALNTITENVEFITEYTGRISKAPKLIKTIYLEPYYFNACLLALTNKQVNKKTVIQAASIIERERVSMVIA